MATEEIVKHMLQYIEEHPEVVDECVELVETISPEKLAILTYEALHQLEVMSVFKSEDGRRFIMYCVDEDDIDDIKRFKLKLFCMGHDLLEAVPMAYDRSRSQRRE